MRLPLFRVLMSDAAPYEAAEVLRSGYIGQGPVVDAFEADLADVLGPNLVTVSSGTAALELALHMCGVGWGSDVVVTPMTCAATVTAILARGGRPVWADIDPVSGLIDPDSVRAVLTPYTRAILGVAWGGAPIDADALARYGVPVIQDAAHAFGAPCSGDYVAYSFQAIKHLTTGDGGALVVPPGERERARRLRWFGLDRDYNEGFRAGQDIVESGFKFHMNDVAAAIGRANLPGALAAVESHRRNAFNLSAMLEGVPGVGLPPASDVSSWWLYTIRVEGRESLVRWLDEEGIDASPVHRRLDTVSAFRKAATGAPWALPGVAGFAATNVCLPVGWWLTGWNLERIAHSVRRWAESGG